MTARAFQAALLIFIFSSHAFSQSIADVRGVKIIGKWLLVRHTLKEKRRTVDKLTPDTKNIYEFKKDGTYRNIFTNDSGTVITVGKWKISPDGKQILTRDNHFLPPHNKDGAVADRPLNIFKLTSTDFVTNECLYNEVPAGTSYYLRQ
jgi:hypothetical protein